MTQPAQAAAGMLRGDLSTTLATSNVAHHDHPFLSVQSDWELTVSNAPSPSSSPSSFWISSTSRDHDTTEGKVTVSPPPSPGALPTLTASDGFTAAPSSPSTFSASCASTSASYALHAPALTLSPARLSHAAKQPITSVALSPTSDDHVLSGSTEGSLTLTSLSSAAPVVRFVGHAGDVDIARFFPSGAVVLSAALDRAFRVWAIATGQCAAVMVGHQQRITGVELIERGRQFVSTSLDGTVRLWDCGRGKSIAEYGLGTATARTTATAVNACILLRPTHHPLSLSSRTSPATDTDAYEGSLLMTACADGHVRGYDMRAPTVSAPVMDLVMGAPVTALTQCAAHTAEIALSNGLMCGVELRRLQPLYTWRRERDVSVLRMEAEDAQRLWSADELGVVTRWQMSEDHVVIGLELTGIDMEPVRDLATQRHADGHVRRLATASDAVRIYHIDP